MILSIFVNRGVRWVQVYFTAHAGDENLGTHAGVHVMKGVRL